MGGLMIMWAPQHPDTCLAYQPLKDVWASEDNPQESVLSYNVGSWQETWVSRCGVRLLYPLGHLASLTHILTKISRGTTGTLPG